MKRPKRITTEIENTMRNLYWIQGWSAAQVAAKFSVSRSFVSKILGGSRQFKLSYPD